MQRLQIDKHNRHDYCPLPEQRDFLWPTSVWLSVFAITSKSSAFSTGWEAITGPLRRPRQHAIMLGAIMGTGSGNGKCSTCSRSTVSLPHTT
jgi:hypothetical protein